jgi:hypothetical protein
MRQMRQAGSPVRGLGLTACLALLALAGVAPAAAQTAEAERPLPAPVPVADDALTAALETGELSEAEYALERARSLFQLALVRREFGYVVRPGARDATLILRDLALRADDLAGAERAAAKRILGRPDDPDPPQGQPPKVPIGDGWTAPESVSSPSCGGNVCVHWVDEPGNSDAPPEEDVNPANGIPDWVDLTLMTWEDVWLQEIDTIGYRTPLTDFDSPNNGGDIALDVYLDDLGADGVFGYCTSDDPTAGDPGVYAVSAYCVIDNDFAPEQYGDQHTPQEFLEVTSAHEFHHASQFAYDWLEDYWLMEGTATNIEETVYPAIDDNVVFLNLWSPLTRPGSPLDRGGLGNSEYGSWIFWRFLQEKIAGDASIVREIWERADASVPGVSPDDYSLQAVTKELTQRGLPFRDVFAQFATANRLGDYDDAEEAGYPIPPRTATFALGRQNPVVGWRSWAIHHLASRYLSFSPGASASPTSKLRVEVRLPKVGARATVVVLRADGTVTTRRLNQGATGYARLSVAFGRGVVKRVEVVLSNGSARVSSCWFFPGPPSTSCMGRPLDDNRSFRLRAQLVG